MRRPSAIGEVMSGGTVGEVVKSNHPEYKVGDIVEDRLGWQEYAVGPGPAPRKIDPSLAPISTANGVLGMPGMTAYFGLFEVGQPKAGETVVVSAASGAVGQVVGQLAKIAGCRAVGIAGGAKKCAFVKDTLGFDACIDYKASQGPDRRRESGLPQRRRRLLRQRRRRGERRGARQSQLLCARGAVRLHLAIQHGRAGPAPHGHLRRQARHRARLHRLGLQQQVWPGAAPDGRMGALGPRQVQGGHRRGHRQGAARLHRPAARRELRQDAGQARARTLGRGEAAAPVVIPVLVTGIHPSARSGASGTLDPGTKCRDDTARSSFGVELSSRRAGARSGRCS